MRRANVLLATVLTALSISSSAWAQSECSSLGLNTYLYTQGSDGVRHQAICLDPINGAINLPGLAVSGVSSLNGIRFAGSTQYPTVQGAINSLPASGFGSHSGAVVIPFGVSWDPTVTTWGVDTSLFDLATDPRYPQLWMGNGGEFRLMGSGASQAGSVVLNNTGTDGDRASSIVYRTGPASTLRNVWQIRSGNYGNINANVNADDLLLAGYQGFVYTGGGTIDTITNGSAAVVGSGTAWAAGLIGANITVTSQARSGTVLSVQDATHLTLASNWAGTSAGPGAGLAFTMQGGCTGGTQCTGTYRGRLTLGQNGIYIFNPNTGNADPLSFGTGVATTGNRGYILAAPDGNQTTMFVRLNVFQAAGQVGTELRSSNSDAKRKFEVLDDGTNEYRILAADGSTALIRLTEAPTKLGIGMGPSGYLDVQALDNNNGLLIHRTGGIITHNASINSSGNGAFAVNDSTGATQVSLLSTAASTFSLGISPSQTVGIIGTTTNNNANAGSVGEFVSSTIAVGSAVSLTTATTANITSVSLTAGDWDVTGNCAFNAAATTSITIYQCAISTTSATLPGTDENYAIFREAALVPGAVHFTLQVPTQRQSLASTTTVFLVTNATFTVSTLGGYGHLRARRIR